MFRDDFVWGVAASAYQIEGRDPDDGAGATIWDRFIAEGHTPDGYDGSVACDHMHRFREDYALMKQLSIKAYRFSVSWSRLIPDGKGKVNEKAVKLYRDMILSMKENGIEPFLTMYHWELPQALQDEGGWLNDDIVEWFGDYARVIAENFSDICENFITLNEPQCFVGIGYLSGWQAPGNKLPYKETFRIAHNALKAHGKAVINLRKYSSRPVRIGYAPTCGMAYPASNDPEDIEMARKVLFGFYNPMDNWTWNVAWFSDPVILGHYPEEGLKKFAEYLPEITGEDMELIHQPLDFMGQNIYNGYLIAKGDNGEPDFVKRPIGSPKTGCGWPVTPDCLYWGIKMLYDRYRLPFYITENGMSCHDDISLDGKVHDPNRINFLDLYISALQKAVDEGVDVRGYFLWSFLDNMEWDKGYTEKFGIIHVDFETQKRTVKDSAYWYKKVIETNGKVLSINQKPRQVLFLEPVFKEVIWGGNRLKTDWGYDIPSEKTGEFWNASAHKNGVSVVRDGYYKGRKLDELFEECPELFGNMTEDGKKKYDRFPLLVKIIDAQDDLSIQVHPDDEYALKNENGSLGKEECWYILDASEGSSVVLGHNAKSRSELESMISEGRWNELIREIPVKKGDFIRIKPGTVHAIKGGVMLAEIQQNSDITYRLYDYDRLSDGKPRELHVNKCLDVITVPEPETDNVIKNAAEGEKNALVELTDHDRFTVWKITVDNEFSFTQDKDFMTMTVIDGNGIVNGSVVKKGDGFILPCGIGNITLEGQMTIIAASPK
ncbi:MAG: beta-glucosidase [Lachnospiraceae bacterium]|nr:beta-glucosidase [Lachnospiraceae bacterium]